MSCSSKETNFFEAIFIIVRNYAPPHFIYLLFLFFLLFFMHQLAPNAILHFYAPPHFICLLLLFFLLFFMYQLTQIPFQNFFSILCTNRSPSPFDFHSSETSADPHHATDTPHQTKPIHTRTTTHSQIRPHSPTSPRPHAPLSLAVLPTIPPYHCTALSTVLSTVLPTIPPYHCTVPLHRTTAPYPGLPVAPPYNRTTAPFPGPANISPQIQHITLPDV